MQWLAVMKPREPPDFGATGIPAEQYMPGSSNDVFFDLISTPGYTGSSLSLSPASTNTALNASSSSNAIFLTFRAMALEEGGFLGVAAVPPLPPALLGAVFGIPV